MFDKEHFNTLELLKHEDKEFYLHGHNRLYQYILTLFIVIISFKVIFLNNPKKNNFIFYLCIFLSLLMLQVLNSYLIFLLNNKSNLLINYYYLINFLCFLFLVFLYLNTMKIIKILYAKFILSFSICLISSFVIFFIFSLLGNLNEGYLFNVILNLSFLNSLQILTYVQAFIFLNSVILLIIFLRSKNEIIIIKSYLSIKKMMIFFLPIVFLFTFFEINKKEIASFIDDSKVYIMKNNDKSKSKIIIIK